MRAQRHSAILRIVCEGFAMFGANEVSRQSGSAGFIRLFGLSVRTVAERDRRAGGCYLEAAH